ncbi:unnamed protein product, partial [Didymodactylos carnosus]
IAEDYFIYATAIENSFMDDDMDFVESSVLNTEEITSILQQYTPSVLYEKKMKQEYLFNELKNEEQIKWIQKSLKKWRKFLKKYPYVIEERTPTLNHILNSNEILTYFYTIGLPKSSSLDNDLNQLKCTCKDNLLYLQNLVKFIEIDLKDEQYLKFELFTNFEDIKKHYKLATALEQFRLTLTIDQIHLMGRIRRLRQQ